MTAPLEPSRGVAWLPDTPEGENALQVYISEDEALAAGLEAADCNQPTVFEMTEQPSWWDEARDGEWQPGFIFGCLSSQIVFPDLKVGAAVLLELLWPDEWGPAPPT